MRITAITLLIVFSVLMSDKDGPETGVDAPDFTLKGLDGKEVTLSSLKWTKPVVLLFGSCT